MGQVLGVVAFAVVVILVLVVVLVVFQRSLDKPGGRDGLGTGGNGMGVMEDVFSPGRADAREELERQKRAAHVMPSPDEDDEARHGHIQRHPDGTPRSIRIQRPVAETPASAPGPRVDEPDAD